MIHRLYVLKENKELTEIFLERMRVSVKAYDKLNISWIVTHECMYVNDDNTYRIQKGSCHMHILFTVTVVQAWGVGLLLTVYKVVPNIYVFKFSKTYLGLPQGVLRNHGHHMRYISNTPHFSNRFPLQNAKHACWNIFAKRSLLYFGLVSEILLETTRCTCCRSDNCQIIPSLFWG